MQEAKIQSRSIELKLRNEALMVVPSRQSSYQLTLHLQTNGSE